MNNLDSRTIIELATLIGGIIVSVVGSITSIYQRRRSDSEIARETGTERSKIGLDAEYLSQVQRNFDAIEARLSEADRLLREHGITKEPPGQGGRHELPPAGGLKE